MQIYTQNKNLLKCSIHQNKKKLTGKKCLSTACGPQLPVNGLEKD